MRELVVIPAFNESGSIADVISDLRTNEPSMDILVVNDGSMDDTAETLRQLRVTFLDLPVNLGYGAALQTGFRYAFAAGYERVCLFDADGQHVAGAIAILREEMERTGADIVIGSRFSSQKGYQLPYMRRLGIAFFRLLVHAATGERLMDVTSGLQVLSRPVFAFYSRPGNYPEDFPDADVLVRMIRRGFRVSEVPCPMRERRQGQSMHGGLRPLLYVAKMCLALLVVFMEPRGKAA